MQERYYSYRTINHALQRHVVVRIINLFLGFAFQIMAVKILEPAEFAAYAVLLAFLMTAQVFTTFGVDRIILRFIPHLTMRRQFNALWRLISKLATLRFTAILIFTLVLVAARHYIFQLLRIEPDATTLIAIAIWFCALTIWADADALAQSWMMHYNAAFIATLEISARVAVIIFMFFRHEVIELDTIVIISAATSMAAVVLLVLRLLSFTNCLQTTTSSEAIGESQTELDVNQVPSYAAASYISTLGWVITSPLLTRIVGATGLGLIVLGAYSFAQGLLSSTTRALPGMLILPALEPVLMAELSSGGPSPQILGALSLATKLEFLAIFVLLILTTIAGQDILRLLAKSEFAPYYFVIPILLIYYLFAMIYRVLELIVRMSLRHRIFVFLWPLGLLSLALTYLTVAQWGVWSVLVWPIVEIVSRIGVLLIILRVDGAWTALDPARSLTVAACTAVIISVLLVIHHVIGVENLTATIDYMLALTGMLILGGTLFVVKPLRTVECEHLMRILPRSWPLVQNLLYQLTRS